MGDKVEEGGRGYTLDGRIKIWWGGMGEGGWKVKKIRRKDLMRWIGWNSRLKLVKW